MRDRPVQIEMTGKEVLMFSHSMYLTQQCMRNPQWFIEDEIGIGALLDIMKNEQEWLIMARKLLKLCYTVQTTEGT